MKKQVFAALALACTFLGTSLQANNDCDNDVYIGGFAGVNFLQNVKDEDVLLKFKTGFAGGACLGYRFQNDLRVEAEVAYRHNGIKNLSFDNERLDLQGVKVTSQTTSVMANMLYDFDMGYCFTPYLGVGAGWAQNRVKASAEGVEISGRSDGFAYQGMAGVSYRLYNKTDLGLEYRYFASKHDTKDHSVAVSFKRYF